MDNKRLKERFGINNARLAKLTGQSQGAISEKLSGNSARGYRLGPREAGVLACLDLMDEAQRAEVDDRFAEIMDQFSDDDSDAR